MSKPTSVRGLYADVDPDSTWTFMTPSGSANSSSGSPAQASSSYQWSTRPAHNSIFELSPSLSDPEGLDPVVLFKSLVASAVLQYTSTAIAMPWEVGKLLLQVQWVPRETGSPQPVEQVTEEVEEDSLSDSSNEDSYFADPGNNSSAPGRRRAPRLANEQGYVIRRSIVEDGMRPEYVIPIGSADGVWGMIKRVGRFRGEGWMALWKGLLTSTATDLLSTMLQPAIEGMLYPILPSQSTLYSPPILLPVLSHLITGLILSPLDLVRTRLIVQPYTSRHQTYSGPLDALSQIIRDEGGFRGLYLHPHILIPAVFDCTLRPLVALALPRILASYFHIYEDSAHPVIWGLSELGGGCLGLLLTLPFETIRRRLQVQARGSGKRFKACVETRPLPYNGMVDCFWHILTEERSDLPLAVEREPRANEKESNGETQEREVESFWKYTGVGQLYRGFGMRLGASTIVFLLQLLKGAEEVDGGWAEL